MYNDIFDPWSDEDKPLSDTSTLVDPLNEEQRRAVTTTEGPLLIQAGAGSGKTKTLTHRIAYILLKRLALPHQILAVTFTNKAAKEMRERIAHLLQRDASDRSFMPYMGTFHGICVRILRQDGFHYGVPKNFVIFDESDRLSAVKQCLKNALVDEKMYPPRTVASMISGIKNGQQEALLSSEGAFSPLERIVAQIYPEYNKLLREAGALDFDDLIAKTVELFNDSEEVRSKWQQQFRYIMIDEYQDTNAAQYALIKMLVNKEHNNIAVVGDDWQSIYSWRGADYRNILRFDADFPNTTIISLEQNYRSTNAILKAAESVITKNKQRSDKKIWSNVGGGMPVQIVSVATDRAEAEAIVRRVKTGVSMGVRSYNDYAVLYRTNAQSRVIEEMCMRFGIPYEIIGGQKFYDRKEIKDILAYLRYIYQPNDRISFERIVNVPTRAIGAKSLENFWQFVKTVSLHEALNSIEECQTLTPKAKTGFIEIRDIQRAFSKLAETHTVRDVIEKLLNRINYFDYLNDGTIQGESRSENVRELLSVASAYQDAGLDAFLEETSLVSSTDSDTNGGNNVSLMTLHSAKGLEFEVVFMVGLEESVFPHSRALYDPKEMEEERRLMYVGMTRAKKELYLLTSYSRALFGGLQYNPPSRFLSDIDVEEGNLVARDGWGSGSSRHSQQTQTGYHGQEQFAAPLVKNSEPQYIVELEQGDKVRHAVFGEGTIIDKDGDMLAISFKQKGVKKINSAFAHLEKIL